jgi:putative dimethyl sulfoxide reductase chaperone
MIIDKDDNHVNILKGYNMLLYFAGSMIMFEPSEECIYDFWTKGILKTLPVSSMNPRFIKAASQLRDSCEDKKQCIKMLRDDFLRLFTGTDQQLATPIESIYHRNDYNPFEEKIIEVGEFYKSFGWESEFHGKIPDDHLGIQLLFLTKMIEKYLNIDDEVCKVEMRNAIRSFLDQHILSWIPEWNKQIQEYADTLCYKGIGTLIYACSEDLFNILHYNKTEQN